MAYELTRLVEYVRETLVAPRLAVLLDDDDDEVADAIDRVGHVVEYLHEAGQHAVGEAVQNGLVQLLQGARAFVALFGSRCC